MRTFLTYLFIFSATFLLFNCKKYPEGGCERRGPKNIIGDWKLSLYEVNGIDSTELINYNGNDVYKTIKIYKSGSTTYIDQMESVANTAIFSDKNRIINIKGQSESIGSKCIMGGGINYCYRLFFTPENFQSMAWQVLKITKQEIVLSCSSINSYKIKFVKK